MSDVQAAVTRLRTVVDRAPEGPFTITTEREFLPADLALVLDEFARATAPPVVGEALVERLMDVAANTYYVHPDDGAPGDDWRDVVRAVLAALPDPVAVIAGLDLAGVLEGHHVWRGSSGGWLCDGCDWCSSGALPPDPDDHHRRQAHEHLADIVRAAATEALGGGGQ